MFATKRIIALVGVFGVAALCACNSLIDDPNSGHVFLLAENVVIPPINGARDTTTGLCTFTITNATATFKNKPKNQYAGTSPFNDIVLENVHVTYDWGPGGAPLADADFGLGGTVPANGSASAQFSVISGNDLVLYEGATGSLILTFSGKTVSGEPVSTTTGGTLAVGTCQ
jgi:hypothetical protein